MFTSLCLLMLVGCVPGPYFHKGYELGRPASANVGSPIMSWDYGSPDGRGRIVGMRKELIYSGIAQDIVYVNYREYNALGSEGGSCLTGTSRPSMTEAMARPAFYQELKYDISKSQIITFQDVRIQVISADPERLRFTVLEGPRVVEAQRRP
jgi:hypothetical protein